MFLEYAIDRLAIYEVILSSSDHNHTDGSAIVDSAMGKIPRSTERIASYRKIRIQHTLLYNMYPQL